jgi:hypothetical protein
VIPGSKFIGNKKNNRVDSMTTTDEKLNEAFFDNKEVEMTQEQASEAGIFIEDALTEEDAKQCNEEV